MPNFSEEDFLSNRKSLTKIINIVYFEFSLTIIIYVIVIFLAEITRYFCHESIDQHYRITCSRKTLVKSFG